MHKIKLLIGSCSIILLSACAPTLREYHQPQHTNGELFSTGCSGSGPADTLEVQLPHGARFTIRASSNEVSQLDNFHLQLRYYLPENVQLDLIETNIIVLSGTEEIAKFAIDYLETSHWTTSNKIQHIKVPVSNSIKGATTVSRTLFGKQQTYKSFTVSLSEKQSEYYQSFTIVLPDIKINGVVVKTDPLVFKNIQKIGIDPFNC